MYFLSAVFSDKKVFKQSQNSGNASLNGNITRKDGSPYLHVHIGLATPDLSLFGGHLVECVISVTAEIFVNVLDCETGRRFDEKTGINIFHFE